MTQLPAAEGERRALTGYVPQYVIASKLIVDSLARGDFEWIRLLDPDAGAVDDIQIGTTNRVDAYQVKWSRYQTAFTFNQLTQRDEPSLIAQLADGWRKLQQRFVNRIVVVHLLTNDYASTSDILPTEPDHKGPKHFAAFLHSIWSIRSSVDWRTHSSWKLSWDSLRQYSQLSDAEFEDFVRQCELDLGVPFPLSEPPSTLQSQIYRKDIEDLNQYLLQKASQSTTGQVLDISRMVLIDELRWRSRYEFRNRHSFPVNEQRYVPIEATAKELNAKLDSLNSGYLALIGSPGSGKSTLLTRTLSQRPERLIPYYAFIPDDMERRHSRGETGSFFHDIGLAIQRLGVEFSIDASAAGVTEIADFLRYLTLLGQQWRDKQIRTIILIDGIDHIPREQSPTRSLLKDLPQPNQVPTGVCIVLGTRTDQLSDLSWEIRQSISQSDRRVQMGALTRQQAHGIVERSGVAHLLSAQDKDRVFQLSEGHPLALDYILNRIQVAEKDQVEQILDDVPVFEEDIQGEYLKYWEKYVVDDADLMHLLGLISRIQRAFDIDWLEEHFPQVVQRFVKTTHQYFRRATPQLWYFHHSSFRYFLQRRTAVVLSGQFSRDRDQFLHRELADLYVHDRNQTERSWEGLYHYTEAGAFDQVIRIAGSEWFRKQLLAFRPLSLIQQDIILAIQAASSVRDIVKLSRFLLIAAEYEQRSFYLDALWLAQALLKLGRVESAMDHVLQGFNLLVTTPEALEFSDDLWLSGLNEQARFLFDLAEPINRFKQSVNDPEQAHERYDDIQTLLEKWATSAINARSLDEIVTRIRNVYYETQPYERLDEITTNQALRAQLFHRVGLALIQTGRIEEIRDLIDVLDLAIGPEADVWFWLHHELCIDALNRNQFQQAQVWFRALLDNSDRIDLSDEMRVALAEGALRVLNDEELSGNYARTIPQPQLRSGLVSSQLGIAPFARRFRINRLIAVLEGKKSLSTLVPDPEDVRDKGLVYFERAICALAQVWADAWAGNTMSTGNVQYKLRDWLKFFYQVPRPDWTNWYIVQGVQSEFFELMIDAAAQHGQQVLLELHKLIISEWQNAPSKWTPEVKRKIILALLGHDLPLKEWAVEQLELIQAVMYDGKDISGRVDACKSQFEAWIQVGEHARAEQLLADVLLTALGIGYRKDYQFNVWIDWLDSINALDPDHAFERFEWFAKAIVTVKETTEGRATYLAANELIPVAYHYQPTLALQLYRSFIHNESITHESGILELLAEAAKSDESTHELVTQILSNFVFHFARQESESTTLFEAILSVCKDLSETGSIEIINVLVRSARTFALPSLRMSLESVLAEVSHELGISKSEIELGNVEFNSVRAPHSSLVLNLDDGNQLHLERVRELSRNNDSLRHLIHHETADSTFDWQPIFQYRSSTLDKEAVHALAQLVTDDIKSTYHKAQLCTTLGHRLLELEDEEGAWQMGIRALEYSDNRGWYSFYGEARLEALHLVIRVRPQEGREIAWRDFTQNVVHADFSSFTNLITNLQRIVQLLVSEVPILEIWVEIENYLQTLVPTLSEKTNIELIATGKSNENRILSELLVDYIDHPVPIVSQAAAFTCATMLLYEDETISETLRQRFKVSGDVFHMHLIALLHSVALRDKTALVGVLDLINDLSQSLNLAVRMAAQEVSALLGVEQAVFSHAVLELPAIYRLALIADEPLIANREFLLGDVLPDTRFASEVLVLYDAEISTISSLSNISEENIRARVLQFMRQLGGPEAWTAEGESRLRDSLSNTGLTLTYVRPRQRAALAALYRVLGELYDANVIGREDLEHVSQMFNFYDPKMILVCPQVRPEEILPIFHDKESRYHIDKNWQTNIATDEFGKLAHSIGNSIVVGEWTTITILGDDNPSEIRQSQIGVRNDVGRNLNSAEQFFARVIKRQYAEYEALSLSEDRNTFVVFHSDYGYISQNGKWLAFNPMVARHLRWSLAKDGLFRWVSEDGRVMVESIRWSDCTPDIRERLWEEVAEGWIVIATSDGWSELKLHYPELNRYMMIERQLYIDRRLSQKVKLHETPVV